MDCYASLKSLHPCHPCVCVSLWYFFFSVLYTLLFCLDVYDGDVHLLFIRQSHGSVDCARKSDTKDSACIMYNVKLKFE